MPQLMPLPWILSVSMIMLLILMAGLLYSKIFVNLKLDKFNGRKKYLSWLW